MKFHIIISQALLLHLLGCSAEPEVFVLPFEACTGYTVGQGFDGSRSHRGLHAVDWRMSPGTPVTAARSGIVVAAVSDRKAGDLLRSGAFPAGNFIVLKHEERVFSRYLHLQKGGVMVSVGQAVASGEIIGKSGNTGFSYYPHLHFDVTASLDSLTETIAFSLVDSAGRPQQIEENEINWQACPQAKP